LSSIVSLSKRFDIGWLIFTRYEGEWKKDERHGWGKIAWTTGGYYIGQWFANAKQGFGFQSYGGGSLSLIDSMFFHVNGKPVWSK